MDRVIHVRAARPEDAVAMGRVHVRAWQSAYRGLMPAAYLDGLSAEERAAMWEQAARNPRERRRVIVAERDGSVVGFAALGPSTSDGDAESRGQLYSINVDPDHWGTGAGSALLRSVHSELTDLGFSDAVLWVHPQNARARHFYERADWICDDVTQEAEVLGIVVPEVRYRRPLANGNL